MTDRTLTPLQAEILLNAYCTLMPHRVEVERPPIYPGVMRELQDCELLRERTQFPIGESRFSITDRGIALVEAMLSTPLPVQKWVMP